MSERQLRIESIPGGRPAVIDIASGEPIAGVSVVGVLARDGKVVAMLQVEGVELRTMLMAEPDALRAFGSPAAAPQAIEDRRTRKPRRPRAKKAAGGGRRSKRAAAPKPTPARKPSVTHETAPVAATSAQLIENAGITVCLVADGETISHRDQEIDLKDRQAVFLAALAKASPAPVEYDFIARRVWAGRTIPEFAVQILGTIAGELRAPLALIGLQIKTVRGIGYALQPSEA